MRILQALPLLCVPSLSMRGYDSQVSHLSSIDHGLRLVRHMSAEYLADATECGIPEMLCALTPKAYN